MAMRGISSKAGNRVGTGLTRAAEDLQHAVEVFQGDERGVA